MNVTDKTVNYVIGVTTRMLFFFSIHPRSGMKGVCVNLEADIITIDRTDTLQKHEPEYVSMTSFPRNSERHGVGSNDC